MHESRHSIAERLANAAEELDRAVRSDRHACLLGVLHTTADAMTDAIATLVANEPPELHALRERTREFEKAQAESVSEMQRLIGAVDAVLNALASAPSTRERDTRTLPAIQEARAVLERVAPNAGVLVQAEAVRELMHATSDAVLVALGADAEVAGDDAPATDLDVTSKPPVDFPQAVQNAEHLVSRMSRSGWLENRRLIGQTLQMLAAALAQFDSRADLRAQIDELHLQADRVLRSGEMDFTRGEWVRRGLLAALFALGRGTPTARRRALASWLSSARASIAAIDEWESLGFQRVRTQDAFRCVVDAFKFAAIAADAMP